MARASIVQTQRKRTAELIKGYRKAKSLSQREFGDLCGMDQSAVSRIEHGHWSPPVARLVRVANVIGRSVDDLCGASN